MIEPLTAIINMKCSSIVALAFAQLCAAAHIESFKLPGYGFSWYDPPCAFACYNALSGAPLSCSSMDRSGGGHSHGSGPTTPECRANDTPFLTTLAFCMKEHCDKEGISTWRRERYWNDHITGDSGVLPKWDYTEALAHIREAPIEMFNASEMLTGTVLLSEMAYSMQSNFNVNFDHLEGLQATYMYASLQWFGVQQADRQLVSLFLGLVPTYQSFVPC